MVLGIWLACLTAAAAQLPPEVLVDKYLLQAQMLSEEKDYKGALEAMDRIVALQREHNLTLPEVFSFQYAQTALAGGAVQAAIDAANRYLAVAGREGKHYREVLELLVRAERKLQEPAVGRAAAGSTKPDLEPRPQAPTPQALKTADAQPVVDCRNWNSSKYFRKATVESVTACLAVGADPNARDDLWKRTPLHWAAKSNWDPAVTEALLQASADVNVRDDDKKTPLIIAAMNENHPRVIEALLKAGANALADLQWTPLHVAVVIDQDPTAIEALLQAGANLNARGRWKSTPLHLAARHNPNPAVIEALLKAGADPRARDKYKRTPLHEAAGNNANPAVIETLLKAGADPMALNKHKDTPLHWAARANENLAVIEALTKGGADPNAQSKSKSTPLHWAAAWSSAVLKAMLQAGADARADLQWTPLHVAVVIDQDPTAIEALLQAGADPNVRDDDKSTPLHWAARRNPNPAVIEALLRAGADPNAQSKSKSTPLHWAVMYNRNPAVTEVLLQAGAILNAQNKLNNTPLHLAAGNNPNPAVTEALLSAGADLAALNEDGRTPFNLMENNTNLGVRQVLLAAGAAQVEKQIAADRERNKTQSRGSGGWAALVAGVTGAAIGAAGGLDAATATEIGTTIGGSVLTGEAAGNIVGGYPPAPTGGEGSSSEFDRALRDLENSCGERYQSAFSEQNHGRFYCLDAFARHCALKKRHNQQQLDALRHDFEALRSQGLESGCPYFGVFGVTYAPGIEREAIDRAEKEARKARQEEQRRLEEQAQQAAQKRKRGIEENNARVLASDCSCIRISEKNGKMTCLDGFVNMTKPCDITR